MKKRYILMSILFISTTQCIKTIDVLPFLYLSTRIQRRKMNVPLYFTITFTYFYFLVMRRGVSAFRGLYVMFKVMMYDEICDNLTLAASHPSLLNIMSPLHTSVMYLDIWEKNTPLSWCEVRAGAGGGQFLLRCMSRAEEGDILINIKLILNKY